VKLNKIEVAAIAEIDASYFSTVVDAMNVVSHGMTSYCLELLAKYLEG
jgi:hypothetical protein